MDGHVHCAVAYFLFLYWSDVTRYACTVVARILEDRL
jgi:hypothetical protein